MTHPTDYFESDPTIAARRTDSAGYVERFQQADY